MADGWTSDKRWSDRFIPQLKRIAGGYLMEVADEREDQTHNTDLIVLTMRAKRVACRVRQYRYLAQYADEFTIRCKRPSGAETELDKILAGWGDYLLYAFADEAERTLVRWHWIDLGGLRLWCLMSDPMPGVVKPNGDGSSLFRAFSTLGIPPRIVLATVDRRAALEKPNESRPRRIYA